MTVPPGISKEEWPLAIPYRGVLFDATIRKPTKQIADSTPDFMGYIYYTITSSGQTLVLTSDISDNAAFVDKALLINNASGKKGKALDFVKYMLGEDVQGNAEIELPVNNAARNSLIDNIDMEIYGAQKDEAYNEFIENHRNITENVSTCTLENHYFNYSVIKDEVDDFVAGGTTQAQFEKQLNGKAQIYLDE